MQEKAKLFIATSKQIGITGEGETAEEALENFDKNINNLLTIGKGNHDTLNSARKIANEVEVKETHTDSL